MGRAMHIRRDLVDRAVEHHLAGWTTVGRPGFDARHEIPDRNEERWNYNYGKRSRENGPVVSRASGGR